MIELLPDGMEIAYDETGSGIPLLLVHGWPHDRTLWAGQTSGLVTQARCVAPDLRGFGGSTVRGPWSIDQFADDLAIRSGLLAVKNTSYIVKQDVKKVGSGVLVAQASIVFVSIDRTGKPVRVPEEWRTLLPHWPESDESRAR